MVQREGTGSEGLATDVGVGYERVSYCGILSCTLGPRIETERRIGKLRLVLRVRIERRTLHGGVFRGQTWCRRGGRGFRGAWTRVEPGVGEVGGHFEV